MSFIDIFWIFLILSSLQPILRQRMLDAARQRAIARLEAERESRVILLVHRQESMSFLGFPLMRFININDSEEVIRAIHLTDKEVPIDLVLHTPGGLVLAALQIARALKRHPAKVTVFVPHYAMSGGTLIALAADEIVMAPDAVLGPLDPQLGKYPAPSLVKVIREKPIKEVSDETLIYADIAEKAIAQLQEAIVELLQGSANQNRAKEIATALTEGRWTHDYPITPAAATELGLPVTTEMPQQVYQLMSLYPQPVRHQPTVEYVPEPRTARRFMSG
ncbi:MAG: hypothetical protein D6681_11540, partial [Calditrichaeota bacterium]